MKLSGFIHNLMKIGQTLLRFTGLSYLYRFYAMTEKRCKKVCYRMTESMFLARKSFQDKIRDAMGIHNLSDADIAELFLYAVLPDEKLQNLIVKKIAEVAKQKYKL